MLSIEYIFPHRVTMSCVLFCHRTILFKLCSHFLHSKTAFVIFYTLKQCWHFLHSETVVTFSTHWNSVDILCTPCWRQTTCAQVYCLRGRKHILACFPHHLTLVLSLSCLNKWAYYYYYYYYPLKSDLSGGSPTVRFLRNHWRPKPSPCQLVKHTLSCSEKDTLHIFIALSEV